MNPTISQNRRYRAARERMEDGSQECSSCVNVGETERQISMWGGTALAVCGLLRGRASGLALALLGAALIYRGHTGHCQVYEALGYSSADENTPAEEALR